MSVAFVVDHVEGNKEVFRIDMLQVMPMAANSRKGKSVTDATACVFSASVGASV